MTDSEQLDLVRRHYALNGVGEYDRAGELLTDDFFITIPSFMPFGGTYRGKGAFKELVPLVRDAVAVVDLKFVATTTGPDCAVEIVEFTFAGEDIPKTQVAEFIRFRDGRISEIRPYYLDPHPFIIAAKQRQAH